MLQELGIIQRYLFNAFPFNMFTKISAKSKDTTNKAKKFLLIVCKVSTTTKQYKTPEMKIV